MAEKRSVRFADESANEVHLFQAPAHPKTLWYSKDALKQLEKEAKDAGRKTMMNGMALLMQRTYDNPHLEAQQSLNEFVRSSGARGVEKVICHSHYEERRHYKSRVFRNVLDAQETARRNEWHPNKLREKLRELSMTNSFKAKLFARKMALADQAACSPPTQKDVKYCKSRNRFHSHHPVGYVRQQSYDNGRWRLAIFSCF